MNPARKRRLIAIIALIIGVAIAVGLALFALRQNINLYFTPSQLLKRNLPLHAKVRLGGYVRKGDVSRHKLHVTFWVTDFKKRIEVKYNGVLPSLFRPGQGVIVQGSLNSHGIFIADQVLAKHNADYHPPDVSIPKRKTHK